jgi:hypothetical protein
MGNELVKVSAGNVVEASGKATVPELVERAGGRADGESCSPSPLFLWRTDG